MPIMQTFYSLTLLTFHKWKFYYIEVDVQETAYFNSRRSETKLMLDNVKRGT